ncbi:unnamed protein product [Mucor hiemalis]
MLLSDWKENSTNVIASATYDLTYTRCYCEENIYLLCKEVKEKQQDLLKFCSVIYISNEDRMVPLWKQKAGEGEQPVIWDYHVILFFQRDSESDPLVYDYDTVLSFPCPADEYAYKTFKPELNLKKQFDRYFRVIPADIYLSEFASDRSHMKKKDGTYHAEPPKYPQIKSGDASNNLQDYICMKNHGADDLIYGIVKNSLEFYQMVL